MPMTVLTRVLLGLCGSTLVTTMLPLLYLPQTINAQVDPKFELYDEFKQRTSIPVPGGFAKLFDCDNYPPPINTVRIPEDIGAEGIDCGLTAGLMKFPRDLMKRIAKEGECETMLDCADLEKNRQDIATEPQVCEKNTAGVSVDECRKFENGYSKSKSQYIVKKKGLCVSLPGFSYVIAGVKTVLNPRTVVLVSNATKDIEVRVRDGTTKLSCFLRSSAPIPQPLTIDGGLISRFSVEELDEDQLVRVECKSMGKENEGVYFYIGLSELKLSCTAPTGSKCKAPAWMNISQVDMDETGEDQNGVVQCSLKTPMQLCFPIQTDAEIKSKKEVCGTPRRGGGTGRQGREGLSAGVQIAIAAAVIALIALGVIIIAYMFALKKQQQKVEEALLKLKSAKEEEALVEIDESKPMWKTSSNLQQQYLRKEREMQKAKEEAAKVKKKLKSIDPKRLAGLKGGGSREKKDGEDDVSGVDESVASASF